MFFVNSSVANGLYIHTLSIRLTMFGTQYMHVKQVPVNWSVQKRLRTTHLHAEWISEILSCCSLNTLNSWSIRNNSCISLLSRLLSNNIVCIYIWWNLNNSIDFMFPLCWAGANYCPEETVAMLKHIKNSNSIRSYDFALAIGQLYFEVESLYYSNYDAKGLLYCTLITTK